MDDNFIFVNHVVPRDGLQNQTIDVSPEIRVKLIEKLLDAGVPGVEVASFVSPKAVPRMAGARDIVSELKDRPAALSALVPNLKGYDMARDAGAKIISVVPSAAIRVSASFACFFHQYCPMSNCPSNIRININIPFIFMI